MERPHLPRFDVAINDLPFHNPLQSVPSVGEFQRPPDAAQHHHSQNRQHYADDGDGTKFGEYLESCGLRVMSGRVRHENRGMSSLLQLFCTVQRRALWHAHKHCIVRIYTYE